MGKFNRHIGIFSFFSGSGFLDLGFEMSGFEVLYVSELSPAFMDAYKYSRQNLSLPSPKYGYYSGEDGDIEELVKPHNSKGLEVLLLDSRKNCDVVGFIGGSPCPDFSIGGKNRGRNGDKGKLSSSYAHLICHHQPDFFLFENVKGLWKTKQHREFYEELKTTFYQSGYLLTERLVNAIEYGVPQDRYRIILLGYHLNFLQNLGLKALREKMILDFYFPWNKFRKESSESIFSYPWPQMTTFVANSDLNCPIDIPSELTVEHWFQKNKVWEHPNSNHHFRPRQGLSKFQVIREGDDSRKSFKRLHRWRYSPTACYGNNEVHLHPYKTRRISVAEALAIQSLPKEFSLPCQMSLTNMFKTIGNGVPHLLAKGLAESIKYFINEPSLQPDIPIEKQLEIPF